MKIFCQKSKNNEITDTLTALAAKQDVACETYQGEWIDIGRPWDLLRANSTLIYNYSMVPADVDAGGNGTYTIDNITVNPYMLHDLAYVFSAVDTSGNWNRTEPTTVGVLDDDRPQLDEDLSDIVAFTGSSFMFTINLSDNVHIGDVCVEYWFGEDPSGAVNSSMSPVGAWSRRGIFSLSILVPLGSIEPLHYQIAISDRSDNWNRSATVSSRSH